MLRALFLLLCLLAAPGLAAADETAERDAIQAEVKAAFWAGDFGKLDAMADGWRDGAARTGSGRWKLGLFYATFSSAPTILASAPSSRTIRSRSTSTASPSSPASRRTSRPPASC